MTIEAINSHIQNCFLRLLITDTEFIKQVWGVVNPELMNNRVCEEIARLCLSYYEQFKQAPAGHFQDELHRILIHTNEQTQAEYAAYVRVLEEMDEPNASYVLGRINQFVKAREREHAAVAFAELVAAGRLEEADTLMYKALGSGVVSQEGGLDYTRDYDSLIHRGDADPVLMKTGVAALDKLIGGYKRSQNVIIVGGYKGRKTWNLQNIAETAMAHGLKVLYVSHEVSREELELRFDMMVTKRGTQNIGSQRECLVFDPGCRDLRKVTFDIKSVFDGQEVRRRRRALAKFGGELRIVKYPMGQCTCQEVERLFDYLQTHEGFVPDVFINDYVEAMYLPEPKLDLRHRINAAYIWMKRLGDDRNILTVTASQVRAEALEREFVRMSDLAEDKRKLGNCDIAIAISGTPHMNKMNLGRMTVLVTRSSANMGSYCTYSHCVDIGSPCVSSWLDSDVDFVPPTKESTEDEDE
jgi:replicative DNA helicase